MINNLKPALPPKAVPIAGAITMAIGWYEYFVQLDDRVRKMLTQSNRAETGVTVANLATGQTAGARSFVTDSNATLAAGLGNTVVGGGANKVPVYYDGSAWRIG